MNIETVFGIDYISGGKHYVKISMIIENHGAFAVIYNRDTNKIQCQKFHTYPLMHKITHGESGSFCCEWARIKMKDLDLSESDKKGLSCCASNLTRSFRKYLEIDPILDLDVRREVINEIHKINKVIHELCEIKIFPSKEIDEWTDCGVDNNVKNDLNEIIRKINANNNPVEGIEHNGKRYRFFQRDGNMVFQTKKDNEKSESIVKKTRDTIQMVKMINAEGLTNVVVNGNFYPIVRTNEYNGKNFVTIKVDDNEITVLQDRVKLVNVFTDILEN